MTYHVQGKLTPTNHEAVNEDTRHFIRRAAVKHRLTLAITDTHKGAIFIAGTFGYFGKQTAFSFVTALGDFIQDENIVGLGLQGQLLIAEEGTVTTPVNVREGVVIHQLIDVETRDVALLR
jgi:hypothetical protein